MSKIVKGSIITLIALSVMSGCARRAHNISSPCQPGVYCYKNINFGPSKGRSFEQGVRDGCRTKEGTFTKDYSKSNRDKNYVAGWILGLTKCKQKLPNEGTMQEEINSRKRAEYQIQQMRLQQESSTATEENIVDAILDNTQDTTTQDFEY